MTETFHGRSRRTLRLGPLALFVVVLAALAWAALSSVPYKTAARIPGGAKVRAWNGAVGAWLLERSYPLPKCGAERGAVEDPEALLGTMEKVDGAGGELYSWKGADGSLHFSDDPEAVPAKLRGAAKVKSLPTISRYRGQFNKLRTSVAAVAPARSLDFPKASGESVAAVVYSAEWCSACKEAKSFLRGLGVEVTEKDIDRDPKALSELVAIAGKDPSIPVTVIDGEVIGGFEPEALRKAVDAAAGK